MSNIIVSLEKFLRKDVFYLYFFNYFVIISTILNVSTQKIVEHFMFLVALSTFYEWKLLIENKGCCSIYVCELPFITLKPHAIKCIWLSQLNRIKNVPQFNIKSVYTCAKKIFLCPVSLLNFWPRIISATDHIFRSLNDIMRYSKYLVCKKEDVLQFGNFRQLDRTTKIIKNWKICTSAKMLNVYSENRWNVS